MTWKKNARPRTPALLAAAVLTSMLAAVTGPSTTVGPGVPVARHVRASAGSLTLLGGTWGGKDADAAGLAGDTVNHPDQDPGSLFTVTRAIGARKLWKHADPAGRPLTGAGVTVALLDSGVSAVPGLDGPGKVTYGPDLSAGGTDDTGAQDPFGHGTFMAGLIGANDLSFTKDGKPVSAEAAPATSEKGLAPDARLLSLKLAGADGTTSVDAVIAALGWVVAHRSDKGMNVRVVNLSFGATALQPYQVDPLAAAAEAAWKAGIVVVASAGNDGATADGLVDPALDPFVIAVGASDPHAKRDGFAHPVVAGFSSRGTTSRHADLLAPGTSLVSLRDPGSTIDAGNPQGAVAGDSARRLFRGSGTSQAAAVTSGAVALLMQAHPELTPDQVKATLMATATPVSDTSAVDSGAGEIDLEAALNAADNIAKDDKLGLGSATQTYAASTGLVGVETGTVDGWWNGARWNGARWNGARWNGARWNGARWNGGGWS